MKKKIIIGAIIIIVLGIGTISSYGDNTSTSSKSAVTQHNEIKKTKEQSNQPVKKISKQVKNNTGLPLGTQATTKTGKIYVNMGQTFVGIDGMSNPKLLMILPELSGNGSDIGSHGVAYYNPNELTDKSLIEFVKDVVIKSNCNYVTLININNNSKGIRINTDSTNIFNTTFTKGTLKDGFDYVINKDTSIGFINKDTIEWNNPN